MSDRPPEPAADVEGIVRAPERLAAVRRTGLLDSAPEESFDRLTQLAARLVGAPAAFIALVDEGRDFYKSAYGFGEPLASARQLTGLTFCHYAVAGRDALVISDTRAHPVYSQVPTVETLGVGAYLGIPLVTSGGQAVGSFCVVDFEPHEWRDLDVELLRELAESTLRKIELRLALRDAQTTHARAEQATRAREAILAVVSHDLRNRIHAVRSSASSLLELPVTDDERRTFLEVIHRSAELLARLVADVLELAEIEARGLRLDPSVVDATALVEEAVAPQRPAAARRGLELSVAVPPDLPPVLADTSRIRRVFSNLLGNAITVTPPGGQVAVRAARNEGGVTFSVSDTGEAVQPEHLARMFERSWQASEVDRGGTGLGLAIVESIVRAHGGAISAESAAGQGTTFSFTIPRAPEALARDRAGSRRPSAGARPAT